MLIQGNLDLHCPDFIFCLCSPSNSSLFFSSNVLAYTITPQVPRPYRFKYMSLRFQIPSLGIGKWFAKSDFIKNMAESETWKTTTSVVHTLRTWSRRTIWGDRVSIRNIYTYIYNICVHESIQEVDFIYSYFYNSKGPQLSFSNRGRPE